MSVTARVIRTICEIFQIRPVSGWSEVKLGTDVLFTVFIYLNNPFRLQIFLSLLKLYLEPPTFSPDSSMTDEVEPASVEHALEILHRHAGKVDAQKVGLVTCSVMFQRFWEF